MWCEDLDGLRDGQAGRVGVDDERREGLCSGLPPCAGEDDVEVGDAAVRYPGLRAVENVVRAVAPRPRGQRRDVGARVELGKREGGDRLAPGGATDIALLLSLGTGERDPAAAQSPHGWSGVGEARVASEYLAQQRERTHIETRVQ